MNTQKIKNQTKRIIVCGKSEIALYLIEQLKQDLNYQLVGVWTDVQLETLDANLMIQNEEDVFNLHADAVLITDISLKTDLQIEHFICKLLSSGKDVISLLELSHINKNALKDACLTGQSTYHATSLFPHFMFHKFAGTLRYALSETKFIQLRQYVHLSKTIKNLSSINDLLHLKSDQDELERLKKIALYKDYKSHFIKNLLKSDELMLGEDFKVISTIEPQTYNEGEAQILHLSYEVYRAQDKVIQFDEYYYEDVEQLKNCTMVPYSMPNTALAYSVHVEGEPSAITTQFEFKSKNSEIIEWVSLTSQLLKNSIDAVLNSKAGIALIDASPSYQLDHRLAQYQTQNNRNQSSQTIKKIVIWGPGEIGGAVVREALKRPNIQIVGAKVFSPHKHGQDLGKLVGIEPLGIKATTSQEEILDLDADCVIVTPQPKAIVEGLDQQVLALLKSGKNVITSAAYHNVSMPNWLVSAQKPSEFLDEIADIHGLENNKIEAFAFKAQKKAWQVLNRIPQLKNLNDQVLNRVLAPVMKHVMPLRASPEQLQQACTLGGSSLHGTGVHPSFMAERVGLSFSHLMEDIKHIRFIEAVDFSFMPDGMWGGLTTIGFGLPIDQLNENFIVAKAGDFYYGDVIGNVAHLLYGVPSERVKVVRSFKGIPAEEDFKVGSLVIKKGHAMALHMVHKGYIDGQHFFTNEECWYLGPNGEFRGENLPFGKFETPISYTLEIDGTPNTLKMQLSMDGRGKFEEILKASDISTADQRCALGQVFKQAGVTNPITNATATAILDAVDAVCCSPSGIVIDDIRLKLKLI